MKKYPLIFILFILYGCKSNYGFKGIYTTDYQDKKNTIFNFKKNEYKTLNLNFYSKGKFKVLKLNNDNFLLVCDNLVYGKRESKKQLDTLNKNNDSIYFFNSLNNLGSSVFEINLNKNDSLNFRETYTNDMEKTVGKGKFILKK